MYIYIHILVLVYQSEGFSLKGMCCPCVSGWGGPGVFAAVVAVAATAVAAAASAAHQKCCIVHGFGSVGTHAQNPE